MAPWQCLSHSISCWRNPSFGLTSRLDFTFKYQISFIIILIIIIIKTTLTSASLRETPSCTMYASTTVADLNHFEI